MKILRCFVENFGVLSKENFDFEEGISSIYKENGRGKTTLFVFIKAMLWGLEATTRRNLDENERNKYRPWNEGRFGGWLEFSSECLQRTFRVTRFFGEKESLDVFEVIELSTGLDASEYFDGKDIGFSLLGIDSDGFERTLFLSERNLEIKNSTSITQKIATLASGDDDSYENAVKILDNKRKYYKNNQGRGLIPDLEERLSKRRADLDELLRKSDSIERLRSQKEQIDCKIEDLINEKINLEKRYVQISDAIAFKNAQKSVNALQKRLEDAKAEREEILSRYNESALCTQNLQSIRADIDEIKTLLVQSQADSIKSTRLQISELELKLEGVDVTKDEVPVLMQQFSSAQNTDTDAVKSRLESVQNELDSIRSSLDLAYIDVSDIERLRSALERTRELEVQKNQLTDKYLEISREAPVGDTQNTEKLAIFSLVFALFGAFFAALAIAFTPAWWALAVPCVIACAAMAFLLVNKRKRLAGEKAKILNKQSGIDVKIREIKDQIYQNDDEIAKILRKYSQNTPNDLERSYESTLRACELEREYTSLSLEFDDRRNKIESVSQDILKRLSGYTKGFDDAKLPEMLVCLLRDLERLEYLRSVLKEQTEQSDAVSSRISDAKARLFRHINLLCAHQIGADAGNLIEISEAEQIYGKAMLDIAALPKLDSQILDLQKAIKDASSGANAEILEIDAVKDEGELLREQELVKERSAEIQLLQRDNQGASARLEGALEALFVACDDIPALEQEIDDLLSRLENATAEYLTVTKTAEYLEKAKNSLTARYLGAIRDSFESIFCEVTKEENGTVKLDSKLALKLERDGIYRDVQYFSRGFRDIMDFALRMALVKTIFDAKEPPIILLDDPFASFDEKHLAVAKECVSRISEQYQIIYTTCDKNREI